MPTQPLTLVLGALVAVLATMNLAAAFGPSERDAQIERLKADSHAFVATLQAARDFPAPTDDAATAQDSPMHLVDTADPAPATMTFHRRDTTFRLYPAGGGQAVLVAEQPALGVRVRVQFDKQGIQHTDVEENA